MAPLLPEGRASHDPPSGLSAGSAEADDLLARGRALALALREAKDPYAGGLIEALCNDVERARQQVVRLGLDLHDESLQDLTALRNDLQLFRAQLGRVLENSGDGQRVVGRVDDFLARVRNIDAALRELAASTRAALTVRRPLSIELETVVEGFSGECAVALRLDPHLDSLELAELQRVALVRVVQSALANVLQHSDAAHASVTVRITPSGLECEIADDGRGFAVDETLRRAAATGRLGLAGMRDRMAMLGGTLDVASRPGGPTRLSFRLPIDAGAARSTPGPPSS